MAVRSSLSRGHDALAAGDWAGARVCFAEAVAQTGSPDALDGLGRAQWWLKDVRTAMETRTVAHREYKRAGRLREAAAVAVWLAREYRPLLRTDAPADGWLARAETLASRAEIRRFRGGSRSHVRKAPRMPLKRSRTLGSPWRLASA